MTESAPGWYQFRADLLRWWDGAQWTDHYAAPIPNQTSADEPVAQPSSVQIAVRLLWVHAALGVVYLAISLTRTDTIKADIRDRMRNSPHGYSQAHLDHFATAAAISGMVFAVLMIAFWVWMAWKNRQGRNWARILVTVILGLGILGEPIGLTLGHYHPAGIVIDISEFAVSIAILVLLWRKQSSKFYEAHNAQSRVRA